MDEEAASLAGRAAMRDLHDLLTEIREEDDDLADEVKELVAHKDARIEALSEVLRLLIRTFGHLAGFETNLEIARAALGEKP